MGWDRGSSEVLPEGVLKLSMVALLDSPMVDWNWGAASLRMWRVWREGASSQGAVTAGTEASKAGSYMGMAQT